MLAALQRLVPIGLGIAFGILLGLLLRDEAPPPASYAGAVARAAPAVVNVYSTKIVRPRRHPLCDLPRYRELCRRLGGDAERMQRSLGSGVVMDEAGHVITNEHVIAGADEILVALADGRETPARLVGADPESDLAVLRIDLDDLHPITLAEDPLQVGDVVLAIGNPFGVGRTVSQGIVSALGRYGITTSPFADYVQTDAAINPGNSGGALVDAHGRLVGVNTLIYSRSGGSQGIGFAIPAALTAAVLEAIVTRGRVIRGWLGVGLDTTDEGIVVATVMPGGPAAAAGVRPGDRLVAIDGTAVAAPRRAVRRIAAMRPGETVELGLERRGEQRAVTVVLGRRPRR